MKAILLVAHGSRRQASNDEVLALAGQLRDTARKNGIGIIHAAFLDMAQPSITEGVGACVRDGASSVTVLPYFLNSGRHVTRDIPAALEEAGKLYPQLSITIGAHLGESGLIKELLIRMIENC